MSYYIRLNSCHITFVWAFIYYLFHFCINDNHLLAPLVWCTLYNVHCTMYIVQWYGYRCIGSSDPDLRRTFSAEKYASSQCCNYIHLILESTLPRYLLVLLFEWKNEEKIAPLISLYERAVAHLYSAGILSQNVDV